VSNEPPRSLGRSDSGAAPAAPPRCPLTAAIEAIGGRWSLIVLYWIANCPRGFNDLQRMMPSISHKVLSQTLRSLEAHRLIARSVVDGGRRRTVYAISRHGQSVLPILELIRQWGHAHIAEGDRSLALEKAANGSDWRD
jgi:DNA-binding HxlR family transcriptional regulator